MSSPLKHLIVGIIGGAGIYAVSHDLTLSAGFFVGSWLITDLDHIWAYWKAIKFSLPKMVNVKEFFRWNDMMFKRFLDQPYLCWLPLHTFEFFLFWLYLVIFLFQINAIPAYLLCLSAFIAIFIHFIMDRLELRMKTPLANKYCYSAIEYWWRKNFNKEMTYEDVWNIRDIRDEK